MGKEAESGEKYKEMDSRGAAGARHSCIPALAGARRAETRGRRPRFRARPASGAVGGAHTREPAWQTGISLR